MNERIVEQHERAGGGRATPVSRGRRRLSAAAFAAPLIATLGSPRSAAAASLTVSERLSRELQLAQTDQPDLVGTNAAGGIDWARESTTTTIWNVWLGGTTWALAYQDAGGYRSIEWGSASLLDVKTNSGHQPQNVGTAYKLLFYTSSGDGLDPAVLTDPGATPLPASALASLSVTPV